MFRPTLAGAVDIDLRSFIFIGCIAGCIGLMLLIYFMFRGLSKSQWLIASCLYLSLVLFCFWIIGFRIPVFDSIFQKLQPYASIVLLIIAGIIARNKHE
jgi:hypothetical protein